MGRLWGKNYADAVREDLKLAKEDINSLKAALAKGDEAFKAEFLRIFKVAYDPANITAYEKAESMYSTALQAKANEDNFKGTFRLLIRSSKLQEEQGAVQSSPTTGGSSLRL